MGLVNVQQYLKGLLDGLPLPYNIGALTAYIQPPNPGEGSSIAVYIWASRGEERRETIPRAQPGNLNSGGDKSITHHTDLWVVWLVPADDPNADNLFPSAVDAILACLRNTPLLDQANQWTDPVTGRLSDMLNTGENLSWELAPVRAVADQRYLRYDALITVEVQEWFQA